MLRLPNLHRDSSLPKLSCTKLATLQSGLGIRHAWRDHDPAWKCNLGQPQQRSNQPGIAWAGILENRHRFWHRGNCHGLCQHLGCKIIRLPSESLLLFPSAKSNFQSYIFRDTKIGLNARQVRSHGAVAEQKVASDDGTRSMRKTFRKSFHLGRKDTLPSYYSNSVYSRSASTRSEKSAGSPLRGLQISNPTYTNTEQFSKYSGSPEVATPNLAHHPAMYSNRV